MRLLASARIRGFFATLVMFTLLAGDAWRYSVSWWGFGIIAVGITVTAGVMLFKRRRHWRLNALPYPLIAFLLLATASIAWSHYPGATALGILVTWMTAVLAIGLAVSYRWFELLKALGTALRLILGLSLLFELVVSLFVRAPVLPLWVDYGTTAGLPKLLYWSRNELFEVFAGGRIQGIVGNSSLLAFAALLGLIVFGIQLAAGTVSRLSAALWFGVAVACVLFTRSATITVGIVACLAVLGFVLMVRRAKTDRGRVVVYWSFAGATAALIAITLAFSSTILSLLGKSDDLTGRLGIWEKVIDLAQQRPAFGWGWVGYWVPWVDPFDDLVIRNGVLQLHAHNAWLDIWLQLGLVGIVVFSALVLSTLGRAWSQATDRELISSSDIGHFSAISLLPILIQVALLVQSAAESRLLIEYGLFLLFLIAAKTKLGMSLLDKAAA